MKKALISIVTLMLLASVTLLSVTVAGSDKDKKNKKAATELKKDSGTCGMAAGCKMGADKMKSSCDPEKCKEMKCEKKDGKCDPAKCKMQDKASNATTMKGCCSAKNAGSCPKMGKTQE